MTIETQAARIGPAESPLLTASQSMPCRCCGFDTFEMLNLGHQPFANQLVSSIHEPIKAYPLVVRICSRCATAQLSYCADEQELYQDYIYTTPASTLLTTHYGQIVDFLKDGGFVDRRSKILEVGSNIGHFLQYIKPYMQSILGIDPATSIAEMANANGIPTINDFFNASTAKKILETYGNQDVIITRHCFAHNEKPWLMLEAMQELLTLDGVMVIENAYFLDTIAHREFDQIYHEHMYYHSLRSISEIGSHYGMQLIDVYHSLVHGGTMVYVLKSGHGQPTSSNRVRDYLDLEKDMHREEYYDDFRLDINLNKIMLTTLITNLCNQGKIIHAYGASAKASTLFNYYNLTRAQIPIIVDFTVAKQGKYIPSADILVVSEEQAVEHPPDYYLLTAWNYKDEIIKKVRSWGNKKSKFIMPSPNVDIISDE